MGIKRNTTHRRRLGGKAYKCPRQTSRRPTCLQNLGSCSGTCPNRKSEENSLLRFGSDTSFGGAMVLARNRAAMFPRSVVWPQDPKTPSDQGLALLNSLGVSTAPDLGRLPLHDQNWPAQPSPQPPGDSTDLLPTEQIKHRWLCESIQMMAMACRIGEEDGERGSTSRLQGGKIDSLAPRTYDLVAWGVTRERERGYCGSGGKLSRSCGRIQR